MDDDWKDGESGKSARTGREDRRWMHPHGESDPPAIDYGNGHSWRRGSESNRRTRLCRPLHNHSATPPEGRRPTGSDGPDAERGKPLEGGFPRETGAAEESRTLDLNLGKVALYQLSYSRAATTANYTIFMVRLSKTAGSRSEQAYGAGT